MDTQNTSLYNEKPKKSIKKEIFEWLFTIIFAFVIAMLIKAFVFVPMEVRMESMQDTVFEGQRLIVYKLGYMFSKPQRGDIVVFEYQEGALKGLLKYLPIPNPQEVDYIKRVIALPGDEVDIKDGYVYINGIKQNELYVKGKTFSRGMKVPIKVPENKLFLMGDNRQKSSDSREIGFIDYNKIIGKAVLRIWPFKDFGGIK